MLGGNNTKPNQLALPKTRPTLIQLPRTPAKLRIHPPTQTNYLFGLVSREQPRRSERDAHHQSAEWNIMKYIDSLKA